MPRRSRARPAPSSRNPHLARIITEPHLAPTVISDDNGVVPCLLALLALISPRLVLFLLWIFSNVLSRAFDSWVVPLLGFFLLPWTTLAYAAFWDWGPGHHVTGFEWFFVALAFVIDLGSYVGGGRARSARG
jgi:hypothetical protein